MNPVYFNALHSLLQQFLMFTVGPSFNFHALNWLGFFFFISGLYLSEVTVANNSPRPSIISVKLAQLETEII